MNVQCPNCKAPMKIAGGRGKNNDRAEGKDNYPPKQCHECGMLVYPEPIPDFSPPIEVKTEMRNAFTLIELLVVMSIIGILMALSLVGLNEVRNSYRRVQTTDEMAQIKLAADLFKTKYGVHPPYFGKSTPAGTKFRLCSTYVDPHGRHLRDSNGQVWPEIDILLTVFPNMDLRDNGLRIRNIIVTSDMPEMMDPTQLFFFWLTGGSYTEYRGFSKDSKHPFLPPVSPDEHRSPLLETKPGKFWNRQTGEYDGYFRDHWGTPYVVHPVRYSYGVQRTTLPLNGEMKSSFQIVCAGPDKTFGPGGDWKPGEGAYSSGQPGADDMVHWRRLKLSATE